MSHWLAIGTPESWSVSLKSGNVWGFSLRYQKAWESLNPGDILICYATTPVTRIIGYCAVSSKQKDARPLFPLETREGNALWPLRVTLVPKKIIPGARDWHTRGVILERKGVTLQRALQRLPEHRAQRIMRALDKA